MKESVAWSRSITVLLAIVCAILCIGFIWLGLAPAQVSSVSGDYRLPLTLDGEISLAPGIEDGQIWQALRAKPLNQAVANAAMVTSMARSSAIDKAAWLGVVASLGWRNVTAQQNVIAAAIQRDDVPSIVSSTDALLRMEKLPEEATVFMNLAEAYPETWPRVLSLLKSNVSWRHSYLGQANPSMPPAFLDGRIRTVVALQNAGDRPDRQQVRPLVAALATVGRFADSSRVWRTYIGDNENVLFDVRFERALAQIDQPLTPLSFDWSLNLGAGYTSDVTSDGLGGSVLSVRWDGRGVPVFFSQQTSAAPGNYVLRARIEGDTQLFNERIGFRLRCGETLVPFESIRSSGSVELTFVTSQPVKCSFPFLEAYGRIGKSVRPFDGALIAISMSVANAPPLTASQKTP